MRVLPADEEIHSKAQEGCVFYLLMKRSTAKLWRDASSTSQGKCFYPMRLFT
ncbi:MAG: hypothetical protein ACPGWR_04105 [Ardenticatenaceae bacterium]